MTCNADITTPRDALNRDSWTIIAATKACEQNTEGISRSFGAEDYTLAQCMTLCETTRGCQAIDFYAKSRYCNLFDRACTNPLSKHDGASSYKLFGSSEQLKKQNRALLKALKQLTIN